jgi:hypothetical protein
MASKADIDAAVAVAEAENGVRGTSAGVRAIIAKQGAARGWTEEENQFLVAKRGKLSEEEIARQLGRTQISVHLHSERELKLTAPSKASDILTGEHIAWGLGMDNKSIHRLIDRGILPGRRLPTARVIRVVDRMVLLRWIADPMHWIYIHPERVGLFLARGKRAEFQGLDIAFWASARIVVLAAQRRWKDAWLRPGEVAQILGTAGQGTRYLNCAIRRGNIKATKWGNWWIRRSDLPRHGRTIDFRGNVLPCSQVVVHGPRKKKVVRK